MVKLVGSGEFFVEKVVDFGFGIEDIFMFFNMYEVSVFLVGGIFIVVDYVMIGKVKYVLNLGGGLYYGF